MFGARCSSFTYLKLWGVLWPNADSACSSSHLAIVVLLFMWLSRSRSNLKLGAYHLEVLGVLPSTHPWSVGTTPQAHQRRAPIPTISRAMASPYARTRSTNGPAQASEPREIGPSEASARPSPALLALLGCQRDSQVACPPVFPSLQYILSLRTLNVSPNKWWYSLLYLKLYLHLDASL